MDNFKKVKNIFIYKELYISNIKNILKIIEKKLQKTGDIFTSRYTKLNDTRAIE